MGPRQGSRVDWRQWHALTRASLRNDLRRAGTSLGLASGGHPTGLAGFIGFQVVVGGVISVPLWSRPDDLFPGAALHLTYLALSVGALLLLDASALIVSPADHDVVAPRPVSPRTFFAARAATMLVYVAFVAGSQSLVPVVAYFFAGGFHPGRGLAGTLATLAVGLGTAGVIVGLHGAAARALPARRLRIGLTVVQLAFSLVLYGSLVVVPGRIGRAYLLEPLAERPWWLAMLPTAVVAEAVTAEAPWWLLPAAFGVAALAWWAAARVLSIEYVATLSAVRSLPSAAAAQRPLRWAGAGETRAVALIARAQFRDDLRFRMAVLSILPLTVIYLLLGLSEDVAEGSRGHPAMIYVAVLLFPGLVRGAFSRSDAYRAAWIFHASPSSAGRLLLGVKNVIVAWFLVPYSLAVGVLLFLVLPSAPEALLSTVLPPLCGHLVLLALLMADPALPFSRPPEVAANTRTMLLLMAPALLLGQLLPALLSWLAQRPAAAVLAVAGLVAANTMVESVLRRRVDRLGARAEFSV